MQMLSPLRDPKFPYISNQFLKNKKCPRLLLRLKIVKDINYLFNYLLYLHVVFTLQVDVCKRVIHLYRSVVLEVPMESTTWYVKF